MPTLTLDAPRKRAHRKRPRTGPERAFQRPLVEVTDLALVVLAARDRLSVTNRAMVRRLGLAEKQVETWDRALRLRGRCYCAVETALPTLAQVAERIAGWEPTLRERGVRVGRGAGDWHCDDCLRASHPKHDHPRCDFCECLVGPAHEQKQLVPHAGYKRVWGNPGMLVEDARGRVYWVWLEDEVLWHIWHEGQACPACAGIEPQPLRSWGYQAARADIRYAIGW